MAQHFIKNPSSIFRASQQHRNFQANRAHRVIKQPSQASSFRNRQLEQRFRYSPTNTNNNNTIFEVTEDKNMSILVSDSLHQLLQTKGLQGYLSITDVKPHP